MGVEFSYSACLVRLIPKASYECLHFSHIHQFLLYVQCLDICIWTLELQVDSPLPSNSADEKPVIVFLLGYYISSDGQGLNLEIPSYIFLSFCVFPSRSLSVYFLTCVCECACCV